MKNCIKCLALLGLSASLAFAHETFNKSGQLGFDKTYSAQSMKHGQLGISVLGDISNDKSVFSDEEFYSNTGRNGVSEYYGANGYFGMSFGMFEIVDVAVMLPLYYDHVGFDKYTDEKGKETRAGDAANQGYLGNLRASLKFRAPLPEDQLFDIALLLGMDFPTTDANKRGLWIREPDYINRNTGVGYAYGNKNSIMRFVLAATMDMRKIEAAPILIHLNGGYRFTVGNDNFPGFYNVAAGIEIYPLPVVSIFGEYYMDIFDGDYEGLKPMTMNEASVGLVFHIGSHLDLQVGGHFAVTKKYTEGRVSGGFSHDGSHMTNGNTEAVWTYKARTVPQAYGFGGITWSGFLIDPDRDGDGVPDSEDKCPDERGDKRNDGCPWPNPDLDEDGICDAWVAEKGLHSEFAEICEGIDQCPNEQGAGSDGCPLDNPDPDADGVCDPWVSQKNMLAKFADVCTGIDECPAQAGSPNFSGCPTKLPDPDNDSLCSPWVTDEGLLAEFANVCKGYDMCPGEAGPVANKGCPWPDPDVDGDGLCDAWVTEKQLGYFFENPTDPNMKQCKGVDKCPAEYGPIENEGCPLGNPDSDQDSVCDAWVSERGMLDDYKSVCTGVDKCPNEKGPLATDGCPTEDPDVDHDGVCDAWVTQKGMQDVFKDVCTGLDKCPYDSGSVKNDGCPLDNPDSDADGVCDPWVTQKGMLDMFAGQCSGLDKCPFEAGSPDADGCPVEEIKLEVYFASGKAKLTANSKRTLRELAKKLNSKERKDERYQILGYTDDRGNDKSNLKLSQKRADAVVTELVKNGVDKSRLEAVGMGEADPVADNSTAEGRELNRRIMMKRVQ